MADNPTSPLTKKPKFDDSKCLNCGKYFRKMPKNARSKKFLTREDAEGFTNTYGRFVQVNDVLCGICHRQIISRKYREEKPAPLSQITKLCHDQKEDIRNTPKTFGSQQSSSTDITTSEPSTSSEDMLSQQTSDLSIFESPKSQEYTETVSMPFKRVVSTHKYCFICQKRDNLRDVPFQARIQIFERTKLFIPNRNRVCQQHLIGKRFFEDQIALLRIHAYDSDIEITEIPKFMNALSKSSIHRAIDKVDYTLMSEERVFSFTGHNWNNILKIHSMMSDMRDSENRNVLQALVIFLFKLRSGNSNNIIAAIMEVNEKVVEDSIHSVLKSFKKDILPKYFGMEANSREVFMKETAPIAKQLHEIDNKLVIICDGTYMRHQKSSNNLYQRKSYSGQKKVPLCKPFTICTTNGFIIDVPGPFNGTCNDAEILKNVIKDPTSISNILKPGDIFILDRGFRDVIDLLKNKGFQVLMPALKGKRNQLTTEESNESRFVTKLRWVVESVHGIIGQKYKLLHHQFDNKMLHVAGDYCRIACFLHNEFGKRLNMGDENENLIIERMQASRYQVNTLSQLVSSDNLDRKRIPFRNIASNDLLDFPELTLDELKIFFTGSYQLSQAISYLGEMLEDDDLINLKFLQDSPNIVRFEIRSRHINLKTYKCYVKYNKVSHGIEAIEGYCCSCANGLRTVGCCSHVASTIYYLSYGRYLSKIIRPAQMLSNIFDLDNMCPVIEEDSDED